VCLPAAGEEAIAPCTRLLALDPTPFACNNRGNGGGDEGDYDSAIAYSERTIRLDPNHDVVYNNRGIACYGNPGNRRPGANNSARSQISYGLH
jgi:lipoprotein NlpI